MKKFRFALHTSFPLYSAQCYLAYRLGYRETRFLLCFALHTSFPPYSTQCYLAYRLGYRETRFLLCFALHTSFPPYSTQCYLAYRLGYRETRYSKKQKRDEPQVNLSHLFFVSYCIAKSLRKLLTGVGPVTSSLPMMRSTT